MFPYSSSTLWQFASFFLFPLSVSLFRLSICTDPLYEIGEQRRKKISQIKRASFLSDYVIFRPGRSTYLYFIVIINNFLFHFMFRHIVCSPVLFPARRMPTSCVRTIEKAYACLVCVCMCAGVVFILLNFARPCTQIDV